MQKEKSLANSLTTCIRELEAAKENYSAGEDLQVFCEHLLGRIEILKSCIIEYMRYEEEAYRQSI